MRNISSFILAVLLLLISSCEEGTTPRKLRLVDMTPVECDKKKDLILEYQFVEQKDTVVYVVDGSLLTLTIGYNGNCCSTFITQSGFVRDTIEVELLEVVPGTCNCICYFSTDLIYAGLDKTYYYTVVLPDKKVFRGVIVVE